MKININCDSKPIPLANTKASVYEVSGREYENVEYIFPTTLKCKDLEESKILVSIEGLPENIEEQIIFKHKWQFVIEY